MFVLTSITDAAPTLFAYLDPGQREHDPPALDRRAAQRRFFLKSSFAAACQKVDRLFRRGDARRAD